jgi:hypothetical protein
MESWRTKVCSFLSAGYFNVITIVLIFNRIVGQLSSLVTTTRMVIAIFLFMAGPQILLLSTTSSKTLVLMTHPLAARIWAQLQVMEGHIISISTIATTSPLSLAQRPLISTGLSERLTAPVGRSPPEITSTHGRQLD